MNLCVARAGDTVLAVDGAAVRRVAPIGPVTRLPRAPDHLVGLVADGADPEDGALPGPLPSHLRDGDVEAIPHSLTDGERHTSLLFERLGTVYVQLDAGGPDDHQSSAGCSWCSKASITSPILTSLKPSIPMPHS